MSGTSWRLAPHRALTLPAPLSAACDEFLRERFPKATTPRLDAVVRQVSETFTSERGALPGSYLNQPPVRSAYLAHFHPQQVLRGMAAMSETFSRAAARGLMPGTGTGSGSVRVADLGAGLGALTQAMFVTADAPPIAEVTLVDHQRSAGTDARDLTLRVHAALGLETPPPRVRTATERIDRWLARAASSGWRYDVVLLGAVLNEERGPWEPLLAGVLAILAPGGMCVIVEPALDVVGRKLMALRESALGAVTTVAPCAHDAECPLLARSRDWCFSVRAAEFPSAVIRRSRYLGHQTHEVRYALWAFSAQAVESRNDGDLARVVSDPMGGEHVLCTAQGEERVPMLRGAHRGDVITRGDLATRDVSGIGGASPPARS